jgi:hypothetical protein
MNNARNIDAPKSEWFDSGFSYLRRLANTFFNLFLTANVSAASSEANGHSDRLDKIKKLYDDGAISKNEYATIRSILVQENLNSRTA